MHVLAEHWRAQASKQFVRRTRIWREVGVRAGKPAGRRCVLAYAGAVLDSEGLSDVEPMRFLLKLWGDNEE